MEGNSYLCSGQEEKFSADLLGFVLYGRKIAEHQPTTDTQYRMPTPAQVYISKSRTPGEILGVFTAEKIKTGTQMGPFVGRLLAKDDRTLQAAQTSSWEILDEDGEIKFYILGNSETGQQMSWLSYVKCARYDREQNLDIVQIGQTVFYKAIKDICVHEELFVWYGSGHSLYFGIPDMKRTLPHKTNISKKTIPQNFNRATGKMMCTVCRKGFNSRSNLRSHMRIHTLDKPFACRYCDRRFSQSSTLRNHTRLHTGEKPYKCDMCYSSYSQLAGLRAHQKSARHRPVSVDS